MPTVLHRLSKWADANPNAPAQKFKKDGSWQSISVREYMDRVHYLALFLEFKGVTPLDAGCVFAPNSPQWMHLDLATQLLGAKSAGIYPNSTQKDVLYILNHTGAKVLSVKDEEFFSKITEKGSQIPASVEFVIVFDGNTKISPKAIGYEEALAEGKKLSQKKGAKSLKDYLHAVDPHAGVMMIYTSGTTGNPKGALLSHDNLAFTADIISKGWSLPKGGETTFSFLPLCHVAEKLQNIGVAISNRYCVNFCTKFDNVSTELPEVSPTLLLSVPRLWEKMMEGVTNKVARGTGAKKNLALWALDVGKRVAEAKYSGKSAAPLDRVQLIIADKLVLSKIREALGLGKARHMASGAAALPSHVCKWFRSIGLEILEDFGQTESTGVICITVRGVECAGTVGKPAPDIEVKVAEDGEILTRGRHVFKGYFKDDAATASTLEGGWLRSGDLGEYTDRGLIRIRGRKKEIMKTSGGKMVAPLPIEEALKADPIISQVCMVGDGRKFMAALITLSESSMESAKKDSARTITQPDLVSQVKTVVDQLNGTLASYEQIKKFVILRNEFSIAEGEMTPTLKMKRNVIETRYRDVIDAMYGSVQVGD